MQQSLRSNLNHRVEPPRSSRHRVGSATRKHLLEQMEAAEKLAKAGESSYRAANALGLHFDPRTGKRAQLHYDNAAASRAGVPILDAESCFHLLSHHPFTQRGVAYPTVHHFVMSERFKDSPAELEIPQAASLWELERLVTQAEENGWERSDWPLVRLNTLVIGTFLKFRQNPEALKVLIRTKQRTINVDTLPAHYQKWVAHERVTHEKPNRGFGGNADEGGDERSSFLPRIGNSSSPTAGGGGVTSAVQQHQQMNETKTIITGSTCKNLGGAILMSLRKKLLLAFQADEKARIKKKQMEILHQQMIEKQKKEAEEEAKRIAKAEAAAARAAASAGGGGSSSSLRRSSSVHGGRNNSSRRR